MALKKTNKKNKEFNSTHRNNTHTHLKSYYFKKVLQCRSDRRIKCSLFQKKKNRKYKTILVYDKEIKTKRKEIKEKTNK